MNAASQGGKSRKGLVAAVLGLALVAAIGAGAYFYFTKVQYAPAHRHVPPNAASVLRGDGLKIATFKPVREHLWPVLLGDEDGGERPDSARVKRIKKHTGISITDLREVVLVAVDATQWVTLVGGTFEPGRFVPGMEKVFEEEEQTGWKRDGELLVKGPWTLAQAEDGTLIMASSRELAKACVPVTKNEDRLPLAVDNAISFAVRTKAYSDAVASLSVPVPGLNALQFDALKKVDHISGFMALSEEPKLQIDGAVRKGESAEGVAEDLQQSLAAAQLALLLVPLDFYGAKRAISRAKVTVEGEQVRMTTEWPYKGLDKAVEDLAATIRSGRALRGR